MRRVFVTGATGFIGSALCARLIAQGDEVVVLLNRTMAVPRGARAVTLPDGSPAPWRAALEGCDAIVHLAARTHRGEHMDSATRAEFWRINVEFTQILATHAIAAEIPHIVFMSSSKVHGEVSPRLGPNEWQAFSPTMTPAPQGPYGESKLAAEQLLGEMAQKSSTGITILRPPLVYGVGMRGNLLTLLNAIARGVPLPFRSILNCRSLVSRDHLVDALLLALSTPRAGSTVYTLADCAQSTPDLVTTMARGIGREPRLWRCPPAVLRMLGRAVGASAQVARLTDSLVLDASSITRELGWAPRTDLSQAWSDIGEWYLRARRIA